MALCAIAVAFTIVGPRLPAVVGQTCFAIPNASGHAVIPSTITAIPANAFPPAVCNAAGLVGLVTVVIADTVLSIGSDAFANALYLTSCDIPDSVTSLGDGVFRSAARIAVVTLSNMLTVIPRYTFAYSGIRSVTLPSGLTSIQAFAFTQCYYLETIVFPATVVSLGDGAFSFNHRLRSCFFANTTATVTIGSTGEAFQNCYRLRTVVMPR